MDKETCSFVEKIGNVSFIVTLKSSDDAKLTHEECVKQLIKKEMYLMDNDVDKV